jgi:hypothetical protein
MQNTKIPTSHTITRENLIKLLNKAGLEIPENTSFFLLTSSERRTLDTLEVCYTTEVCGD